MTGGIAVLLKNLIEEDFVNYRLPSMFLGTVNCDWKCCKEAGIDVCGCQNSGMSRLPTIDIDNVRLINRYMDNPITKAVVFGGLEPMLQFDDLRNFIEELRKVSQDDVVIYTGYYKDEIADKLLELKMFGNIVVKFGRYIPNGESRYDDVLGVTLANKEQYAERL